MITSIYIDNQKLDLFKDESATIVSSVLDITDITKNTGDYSKTFTGPASKTNNRIFKHYYNATIDNTFDARIKVDGHIELDKIPFKVGKWRLSKVNVKKGKPSAYTINFFGKLPSLKDFVKKDLLTDLDLSAFNHNYNSDNVKDGLTGGLFGGDVVYTLMPKKQYYYNNIVTDNTQEDTLANIAFGGGVDTGVIWNDLRPSIKLIRLIEAIEEKYSGLQTTNITVVSSQDFPINDFYLYLDGVQYVITLNTTNAFTNAQTIANYVDALTGYNATWDNANGVEIKTVQPERQEETYYEVHNAIGLELSISTIFGNNNGGISFSRDFFGTSEFTDAYMWLNPDIQKEAGGENRKIDWNGGSDLWMNLDTDIALFPVFNTPANGDYRAIRTYCKVTPDPSYINVEYSYVVYVDGQEFQRVDGLVGNTIFNDLQSNFVPENDGARTYQVYFTIETSQEFKYEATLRQQEVDANGNSIRNATTDATSQLNESIFVLNEELPKLKIIDFLKGLFNSYKLVIVPQDDGTFYVDTLNGFYSSGNTYDVTRYIDFESYNVDRGEILNEIELKFKEPTTLLNIQFEKNNNRGYGDLEETLTDDEGELLDGDSLTFEVPFEQIVYERLNDQNSGDLTNIQYGAIIDEELQPANPSAHIHYALGVNMGALPIAFIEDDGTRSSLNFLTTPFHHKGATSPNYSFIFNREFSTWDGVAIDNTLYKNHYSDYIQSIFNIKKRTFNFNAYLPLHIITKLQLNDNLLIKGNYYRIDKYKYDLLSGKTTLNLINNFSDSINPLSTAHQNINVDYRAQTETVLVTNSNTLTPAKIDTGNGTGWVTVTNTGNNIHIAFDENVNTRNRRMILRFVSSTTTEISLNQGGQIVTIDNNNITVDNDIITVENG